MYIIYVYMYIIHTYTVSENANFNYAFMVTTSAFRNTGKWIFVCITGRSLN